MVKLYSYSSELHTFVEAKWAMTKLATGGILIGTIIFFGVLKPNQSVGNAVGSRSAKTLTAENDILRRQLSLISPRMSELEMQAGQFNERIKTLNMALQRQKILRDTISSFTNAAKTLKAQSLSVAAKGLRP